MRQQPAVTESLAATLTARHLSQEGCFCTTPLFLSVAACLALAQVPQEYRELSALQVAHYLAYAVTTLHRRGYLHRDLKPENIMIRSGQLYVGGSDDLDICLVDFMLAQYNDEEVPMLGGTVGFMCPNTLDGSSHWSPAVDA